MNDHERVRNDGHDTTNHWTVKMEFVNTNTNRIDERDVLTLEIPHSC